MSKSKVKDGSSGDGSLRRDEESLKAQVAAAEAQIVEQSKKIDFFLTEYTVEILAAKMHKNEFVIPSYQREDTWSPDRKSRFIESLLMGLPIPFLFFWEQPDTGMLEIVDGAQRLRTIEQFIHKRMRIRVLTKLTELEGLSFSDLPTSRQRKLMNRSIRGIVLNEHADDTARHDLFDRINTGSKIANPAEVRRGSLNGPFQDLIIELAKDPLFEHLTPHTKQQVKERGREELVARYFGYGDGLDEYRDNPSQFLYAYVKRMNEAFKSQKRLAKRYRDGFAATMKFVQRVFPYGFARRLGSKTSPRSRFEAIAIGSRLAIESRPSLKTEAVDVMDWLETKEFRRIVGSDGANGKGRLMGRISYVKNSLLRAEQ